eukprot:m.80881 g.80881  ORF g.80881 m.80881 type:complete len:481 (+) comp8637_c1_seq1:85-1527(+)
MEGDQALSAAKHARADQLERLEKYLSGEPTVFINHQGKEETYTYEPEDLQKDRSPAQIHFSKNVIFLSIAQRACESQDVDDLEKYLADNKDVVDINFVTADGVSALHTACIENSLKVASVLCKYGINVNLIDCDWWTPLHTASACGHWRIAKLLVSNGADLVAVNADGELPIDLADDEKTEEFLDEEMKTHGFTEEKRDELRKKPENDFLQVVQGKLDAVEDLDEKDEEGITLVHIAACNGWMDALVLLIKNGVDVNAVDNEGNTPLHYAVFFLQYDAVKLLAKSGIDPSLQNRYHEPAVHMTEDPMMIRTMQTVCKEIDESRDEEASDGKLNSGKGGGGTLKRKTFNRGDLKKMEAEQEKSLVKSLYAEIKFNEKERRASEWQQRDEEVEYNETVYTKVTFKNRKGVSDGEEKKPRGSNDANEDDDSDIEEAPDVGDTKQPKRQRSSGSRAPIKRPPASLPSNVEEDSRKKSGGCCIIM